MKKTVTTEEFFYDSCDILTKKITTVEEYEEKSYGGSTMPSPITVTPYPSWVMPPQYKTDITCELSTEEAVNGLFYMSNLIKNAQ